MIQIAIGCFIAALFSILVVVLIGKYSDRLRAIPKDLANSWNSMQKRAYRFGTIDKYNTQLLNKQEYVRQHLDVFGINDAEGVSMDKRKIYVVSPDKMGF